MHTGHLRQEYHTFVATGTPATKLARHGRMQDACQQKAVYVQTGVNACLQMCLQFKRGVNAVVTLG